MGAEQDLYRVLFEAAEGAILVMQDGQFIEANASALALLGYTRKELLRQNLLALSGYDAVENLEEKVNNALSGQKQRLEWLCRRADNTTFPAWISLTPVSVGNSQSQTLIQVVIRDMTEIRQTEAKLRTLSQIVEQSPSSIVITNTSGQIEYVNPKFTRITGYTAEEAMGENPRILKSGEKSSEEYKEMWTTISSGGEWRGEFHNRRKNGELFWEQASISPIKDEAGKITHYLAIKEDITTRKRLEEQLQALVKRRGRQVRLSTQVTQDIATVPDLRELYRRVVTLIQEQFGYYYVQLLRYDTTVETAVLVAGSGEAGKQRLAQAYRVRPGQGPIGTTLMTGASVLKPDLAADPDWQADPLLPDTRSELAVPIKLHDQVLGVLDVQNNAADSLDAEDQLALEGLCGQIAAAIESTRLRQEMDTRLQELNSLQRLMTREGWQTLQAELLEEQAYLFDQSEVRPVDRTDLPKPDTTVTGGQPQPVVSPLTIRGEIIGGLGVYDDPDHPLSAEEQALLQALSVQVAEAMERARLLEQTRKRAVELEAVAQVGTAAATILAIDKLLQTVVDLTKLRFGLYHAHIYLLNETGDTLTLAAGAGEPGRKMVDQGWQIPFQHEHSLVALTARSRKGVIVNDVHQSPDFLPNPLLPHTCAEMAVPLIAGEQLLGVLDVQADTANYFTKEDLRIQTTLAAQVAVALQNARLYQQTEATLAEAQALYHFGEIVSRETELQSIRKTIAHLLVDELDYLNSWIAVVDEEAQVLRGVAGAGAGITEEIIHDILPLATNVPPVLAVSKRQTVVVNDPQHDEQMADVPGPARSIIGKTVATPIFIGEKLVGTIACSRSLTGADIDERDVRLMQAIATQAAVAIQRAQLFTETQEALAATETLYEAGQRINAADSLDEVVEAVVERALIPGVNRASLVLFEKDASGNIETLTIAATWHSGEGQPPLPVGTRFARSVFAAESTLFSTHSIIINDATNDERIDPSFAAQLKRQKTYSLATVPLAVGISQVGTLVLEAEQVHKFTEREIQPYLSLAPQVAVAVENRRLLTETQAALAEVEATQRRYTVQAWENYVTQRRALTYEQTREGLAPLGDQLPVEARQAVTLKQTSFTELNAPNGHEAADTDDQPHPNGSGSSLVVPLTLRGEVIGVLGLQETDGTRQWSPEEIALVEEICEQLTQAAEGIRLLDESQQRAAREARVNEIGEKIQAAQSLEEALQIAVREVGRSLRAPQTRVELEVK